MEVNSSPWNNPDAGNHPVPENPQEVLASIRAAERCMKRFPYLVMRFGKRGEAFARSDSGYLTTLIRFPTDYVFDQVRWLARVLSNRGMPRWLMEVHLEILEEELTQAIPFSRAEHQKLLEARNALRSERHSIISQKAFEELASEFDRESGNLMPNFGGVIVSAVCDEASGIDAAVSSISLWLEKTTSWTGDWRDTVTQCMARARELARQHTGH